MENDLKAKLSELYNSYGLTFLKGGTEWEDMDYREIEFLNKLTLPQVPLLVKIAGPEARVDIRNLKQIGVGGILGPMIESEYALEKFVTTVLGIYNDVEKKPLLAVNIETINGVNNIDSIVSNDYFNQIALVVIGRLDLATSMGKQDVDNKEVAEITQTIVTKVQAKGKNISVGGFVNPKSAKSIQTAFQIDRLNTIHLMFDLNRVTDVSQSIELAIRFEIELYEQMKKIHPQRTPFYDNRIQISQKKLG